MLGRSLILGGDQELPRYNEANRMYGFAMNLLDEKEYYRAITEFKRLVYCYPDHGLAENSLYQIGMCYYLGERYPEAVAAFDKAKENYPENKPFHNELNLMIGESHYHNKNYSEAIETFQDIMMTCPDRELAEKAQFMIGWCHIEQYQWKKASLEFSKVTMHRDLSYTARYVAEELNGCHLRYKSPQKAGLLSAIMPGAGQLYCERKRDGLTSFLLNGMFIWGAVESFKKKNESVGTLLLLFELGWYGGNIYSGINNAHRYNLNINERYAQGLRDRYGMAIK
jgi:TolA-binding protein